MLSGNTAQKVKFSIKNFSSKYDQIRRKPQIWSHLLKKIFYGKLEQTNYTNLAEDNIAQN